MENIYSESEVKLMIQKAFEAARKGFGHYDGNYLYENGEQYTNEEQHFKPTLVKKHFCTFCDNQVTEAGDICTSCTNGLENEDDRMEMSDEEWDKKYNTSSGCSCKHMPDEDELKLLLNPED